MRKIPWDMPLLLAAGALSCISLIALASAAATLNPSLVWRQAVWVGVGMGVAWLMASVPYPKWLDLAPVWYAGAVGLLVIVFIAGTMKLGATRWLTIVGFSLQPSECAKLAVAFLLARSLGHRSAPLSWRDLAGSALVAGLPAVLIFLQPDLGSSSILLAMWLGVVWVAGIAPKQLLLLGIAAAAVTPIGWHALKEFQRLRLLAFINPHADPLGAGYTIIQSQIAIGSGGFWGRGWLSGTQSQLNFLPERHADFLFSVIGEEWGWWGAVLVVACIGCVIWRALAIALRNSESQGRLLAAALVSWLGYQAVINIAMVMGMVPVVGIPLPFVSYGGSAMVMTWTAVGLLQSIHRFGTRF
ncbi:MAG: rod shape-determining protein RodA [Candidatus Omnitrophica bacterium]|nr:rod shape-determining protein RodA [Candidatus Omnitrophota bacterium]